MRKNKQSKVDIKEQHILFIYYTSKLLIKKYSNIKKKLIFLALKVFLDKIKIYIFLGFKKKW